jgi:MFS family permease
MVEALGTVINDPDKSALRILFAIFFWFLGYTAVEAFFSLYAINHLQLAEADGARLLGHLSFIFVLSALPSGYIGARIGRRRTILLGVAMMAALLLAVFLVPVSSLTTSLVSLPGLGLLQGISIFLMLAGVAWALININSLPMVVDMTSAERIGTYTGLYYLFSTLSAIVGPNVNGWVIKLSGDNYNSVMLVAPFFLMMAFVLMLGVRRGEAVVQTAPAAAGD